MMSSMHRSARSLGFFLLFILLAAISCKAPIIGPLLATPTSTSTPTATTTPTLTPTSTPTPTPTPLPETRYELGEKARVYGDWETALGEYQFALQLGPSPEEMAAAEFGIGLTLIEARRYTEALQHLTEFLNKYPEGDLQARVYFLRGRRVFGIVS